MSFSQIGQDLYVIELLKYKTNGIFVDIGCHMPKHISNTYLLETQYGWSGIGIDIEESTEPSGEKWDSLRPNTKLIINDALSIDYLSLFQEYKIPNIIDYLSIDLEPPQLTLECLFKIPFDHYRFNVITFETDAYRGGGEQRKSISREYLQNLGYVLDKAVNNQDDFYYYPT